VDLGPAAFRFQGKFNIAFMDHPVPPNLAERPRISNVSSACLPNSRAKTLLAFSLAEMLFVVAFLAVLLIIFLPAVWTPRTPAKRVNCGNNLKMIGLAFRTWATDYGDQFPMQISATNGGTLEFTTEVVVFPHLQVMSNELSTPKILICPEDTKRSFARNFMGDLRDGKISYFVGINSSESSPSSWLSGDRNFTNCATPPTSIVTLSSNLALGWGTTLHRGQGNICFADGSVSQLTTWNLRRATQAMGPSTNHLVIP
jgi:prepilin-type processing-associated H-X9-DG protein